MEVRIYYGALEQATHFIKPILLELAESKNIDIRLVRIGSTNNSNLDNQVGGILYWKDPDILITAVKDNKEQVLFMIELSTSVHTKDHVLQRFDNYIPLIVQDFIHIKIGARGEAAVEMGGDTDFDPNLPAALILQTIGKVAYVFDWPVDRDTGAVIIRPGSPSCPVLDHDFSELLKCGVEAFLSTPDNWIDETHRNYFRQADWLEELKQIYFDDILSLNTSRTRFVENHESTGADSIVLKFNRFTHAMDPERGMAVYYGFMHDSVITKFVMDEQKKAWYNGGANASRRVSEHIENNGLVNPQDFAICFNILTGMGDDFDEYIYDRINNRTMDINDYVHEHYDEFSKPLKVIFGFTDVIILNNHDDETMLTLNFDRVRNQQTLTSAPTPLINANPTEDELTYIIVQHILRVNNYDIIGASYPAAQGDRVMLVEANTGRAQRREYIDVIAINDRIFSLCENKVKITDLEDDVRKLVYYKTDAGQNVIDNFVNRHNINNGLCLKIGVGFFHGKHTRISEMPSLLKLDYFIAVNEDDYTWRIWHTQPNSIFNETEGNARIPDIRTIDYSRNAGGANV
ncbi:MAG: hypothetical protein MPJ53_00630 [Alphaproteobacteria bacterium]|nr:hypothetical protein [Alphaproteobacteria bacterium]